VKIASIRILLAIASNKNYEIHQMDVKRTFLNKFLQEKITWSNWKDLSNLIINIKFAK
jgi:hypothetical protein